MSNLYILRLEDGEHVPHLDDDKSAHQYVSEYPGATIEREISIEGMVSSGSSELREVLHALLKLSDTTNHGEIKEALEALAFAAWEDGRASVEQK